jgi:hypothetical protein
MVSRIKQSPGEKGDAGDAGDALLSLCRAERYARQTAIAKIEKPNWERIAEHLD